LLYLSWLPAPFNELVVNIFILSVNTGVIILYWSVVSKCGKGSKAADAWYNIKLSIMTLCYLMYSKILTAFLQLFSCTTFNSTFSTPRLEGALDVKCSFQDPVYSKYMSSIGFPILLYIFGLPLVSFIIILRSNRGDKNVLSAYGFLYGGIVYIYMYMYIYYIIIKGFKEDFWFWEWIILGRKICMSAVFVLLSSNQASNSITDSKYQQGLCALFVLWYFIYILLHFKVFSSAYLYSFLIFFYYYFIIYNIIYIHIRVSLVIQLLVNPHKEKSLNDIETIGMIVVK